MNSNLFKKTNDNGWVLCPSKRFPDKFYYFNVATGETAWCLNESERRDLKTPPIQNLDSGHSYPEPNSPPTEEIITPASRQKVKFIPFHENTQKTFVTDNLYQKTFSSDNAYQRTFNSNNAYNRTYNLDNVQKTYVPENTFNKACPSNQIVCYQNKNLGTNVSTLLLQPLPPYQIQVPMSWPDFGNPQMVMILMNQNSMNRQLAIEEPRPPPVEIRSPEPNVPIHTSNTPLSQRFVNYTDPIHEFEQGFEPEFNVNEQQNSISDKFTTNTSNFVHNQPARAPGPTKYSQNVSKNPLIHKPMFRFKEQVRNHDQVSNFATRNSAKNLSNLNNLVPSTSSVRFGAKYWQNPIQNTTKYAHNSNQNQSFQNRKHQTDKNIFGQNQSKSQTFNQFETQSGIFGHAPLNQEENCKRNQIHKESFRQSQSNQSAQQSQNNQSHSGLSHMNQSIFDLRQSHKSNQSAQQSQNNQSHMNESIFDQRQSNQRLQNHTKKDTSEQSQIYKQHFGLSQNVLEKCQIDQDMVELSQSNQIYFNQRPNDKKIFGHEAYKNQNQREIFKESHSNQKPEDQRQKELFRQSQIYKEIFRTTQESQNLVENNADQDIFGQSQRNKQTLRQSPKSQENFCRNSEQNQNEQNIEQLKKIQEPLATQINQEIFGRHQSYKESMENRNNQNILEQSQKNKSIFRQSPINRDFFVKITNMKLVDENDNAKPAVTESSKVQFQKSPLITKSQTSCTDMLAETNSTLTHRNKVDASKKTEHDNLDENDLRRTLLAKKRKCIETAGAVEGKKIRTTKQENTKVDAPKKKVTFNLVTETYSDSSIGGIYCDSENNPYEEMDQEETLIEDVTPSKSKMWYVVTDTKTLLRYFEDLDNFVLSDPKCSLVIPHRVMSEVNSLSRGESLDRQSVITSRQLLRSLQTNKPHVIVNHSLEVKMQSSNKTVMSEVNSLSRGESLDRQSVITSRQLLRSLQTNKPHVIVQPSYEENKDVTTTDLILNCCLEIAENAYVILVTDDENLHTKAETLEIECCNLDQLNNDRENQNKVSFDINKIKISINNDVENYELPTNQFENLTFDTVERKRHNQNNLNSKDIDFQCHTNLNKSEDDNNLNEEDFQNSNLNEDTNKITKINMNIENNTRPKKSSNVSVENASLRFKNNENSTETNKNINFNPFQTEKFSFQKEKKKEELQIASIFKQANEKIKNKSIFDIEINQPVSKKGSIFEIDGIEKLKPQTESNNTIFKNIFKTVELTKSDSIFKRSWGTKKLPLDSNLEKENNGNRVGLRQSIFDIEDKINDINQPKSSIFDATNENEPKLDIDKELNKIELKSDLKEFLYNFCTKNKYIEYMEEKKVGILCSLKQILEESLMNVLKNYSSYLRLQLEITPPYSITEALQGVAAVHADKTISGLVSILTSVFNAKAVSAGDVVKSMGCAILLVKCLKIRAKTTENLNETERALEFVSEQAHAPYFDIKLFRTAPTGSDVDSDKRNRRNFVRDRSYVTDYLKKHFPAWADYDETTSKDKSITSSQKKFKDAVIVRTCGKNISNLTLNNSKPMTMNAPENTQNGDINKKTSQNQQVNHENNVKYNDCNSNNKEIIEKGKPKSMLSKNPEDNSMYSKETSSKSVNEKFGNIKLVRSIKNNTNEIQKINMDDENEIPINIEENQEKDSKSTEPKVIRLFDKINSNKYEKKASDVLLFDDCTTYGHTFGISNQNGPKVHINIKPIKEFEEKLKNDQISIYLDKIDSFDTSISNYINDSTNLMSDSNSIRLVIDENALKSSFDETNDVSKAKNDVINDFSDATNDTTATNNKSYSMSLDNCITNNIYGAINIDDIIQTDDMITSTDDMKIDDFIEMNHGFRSMNFGGSENDDVKYDNTDDVMIFSGYENTGHQAYNFVDTFLYELKIVFKMVDKFIAEAESELRSGMMEDSQRQCLHNSSVTTHKLLHNILEKLEGIIYRETFSGPRVKDLVKGAGSILADDERIQEYRQIVGNCYKHAKMLNIALKMMADLTSIDS